LDPEVITRRDIVIERAKGGASLNDLPEQFRDDDEIVTAAVAGNYAVSC
jgi:hypothetical protein